MIALPPFYSRIPKTPRENRVWRRNVLLECLESARARNYVKEACKADILFYFNGFYWTYDPRLPDGEKLLPFITFPFQDDALLTIEQSIQRGRDLVIYKSRDLGISWLCLGVFEKLWHFHKDQTFMCFARDKDEVDSPAYPDALFQKIDRIHQNTPSWLMPKGWKVGGPGSHRIRFAFNNPENGSTINGEATIDAGGVGGRRTAILLDEFSRIDQAAELDFGTADATNCRIFNFTAHSQGAYAYGLIQDEHKQKLMLHWTMDPRKNRKLYRWNGETNRMEYFEYRHRQGDPVRAGDVTLKLVRTGPHHYGPEDADRLNFREDNGYSDGRPFEPIRDGVLRSPIYDQEDRRRKSRMYMARNWDIDFKGADDKVYDVEMLSEYEREICRDPAWEGEIEVDPPTGELIGLRKKEGGPLRLWFDPEAGWPQSEKGFCVGVDPSHGRGASNSCTSVVDVDSGTKVLEYVTPFEKPELFAAKTVAICRQLTSYGGGLPFLAWEAIGPGSIFRETIASLGYQNVYYDGVARGAEVKENRRPGWTPNPASIRALHGAYDVALRQRLFLNRSALAVRECEKYVDVGGKIEYVESGGTKGHREQRGTGDVSGARENHGDRVTADAICNLALRHLGGGSAKVLAQPKQQVDTSPKPWTLAGRRELVARQKRESSWE